VLGVYSVFWCWVFLVFFGVGCWELGIPWCWVFLVGRFFGNLWSFISSSGIWDWVTS